MVNRPTALPETAAVEQLAAKLISILDRPENDHCLLSSGSRVRVSPGTLFIAATKLRPTANPPRKNREKTLCLKISSWNVIYSTGHPIV